MKSSIRSEKRKSYSINGWVPSPCARKNHNFRPKSDNAFTFHMDHLSGHFNLQDDCPKAPFFHKRMVAMLCGTPRQSSSSDKQVF